MEQISPLGPVYQAGTLSGNPIAMVAGLKTLELISEPEFFEALTTKTEYLLSGLHDAARETGIALQTNQVGAMFGVFFSDSAVTGFSEVMQCDTDRFGRYFRLMLESGCYLAPSAFEAGFVSSAHTTSDLDLTIASARGAFEKL